MVKGFTNKEIAAQLAVTEDTVKALLKRTMRKMGTTTRTSLVSRLIHVV